ncbi:MAG TPA: flagellar hook-length control protein FliK, partial [Candidatus Kapabacteria bacterium]|nr:flagellar hook-length control protein FliK [Candidatus Kapabacteria bacterium]
NQATAKLILEPQWLGTVIVDVLMKNDVAEIKIKARSKETVEAIEKQISVLKEKLSEHGITTGKIDITDENYEERNLGNNTEQQKNKKEEREFLNSFLKTENNNEINQEEANDIFRLWMKKIIEKYV